MNMQIYVITVIKIKILIFYRMNKIIYGFILLILILIIYYWNNIFFYENFKSENNIFNNTKKTFLLK